MRQRSISALLRSPLLIHRARRMGNWRRRRRERWSSVETQRNDAAEAKAAGCQEENCGDTALLN